MSWGGFGGAGGGFGVLGGRGGDDAVGGDLGTGRTARAGGAPSFPSRALPSPCPPGAPPLSLPSPPVPLSARGQGLADQRGHVMLAAAGGPVSACLLQASSPPALLDKLPPRKHAGSSTGRGGDTDGGSHPPPPVGCVLLREPRRRFLGWGVNGARGDLVRFPLWGGFEGGWFGFDAEGRGRGGVLALSPSPPRCRPRCPRGPRRH
ncbi:hypothetical protein LUU34_00964300 [Aix galericulata]|nr:hypothetical protein LUU34_00964300 [Aix galericulata]